MAQHQHSSLFNYFFKRLNPSPTYESQASSQYNTIKGLIEDRSGLSAALAPICFLQGSYQRRTAIYTIDDVDIVALCSLCYPPSQGTGQGWSRQMIFDTVAAPLLADGRYKDKVYYSQTSMCIKVALGIEVEILPVVYQSGNNDSSKEPFYLFRPETGTWEKGYARYHQGWLTDKNTRTGGNFIPAVKVFKHLRSQAKLDVASFHIECFLFLLPDHLFLKGPADYIPALLNHIASYTAASWFALANTTPCGDRRLFSSSEWRLENWNVFYMSAVGWNAVAKLAAGERDQNTSACYWQILLGQGFFPLTLS